jgi:hypothetical protein
MKLRVTFREYTLSTTNSETGEEERGEYCGSFAEDFEGRTPAEILELATQWAAEQSAKHKANVQVWEMPVTVTPRGILSK